MATKVCTRCSQGLPFSEYYRDRRATDGLYSHCKPCHNGVCRSWALAHPEQARKFSRESQRRAYVENPEKFKASSRAQRKDPIYIAKMRIWKQKYSRDYDAKKRAVKKQAMPGWLSESQINEIKQIYIDCPKGHHVDHVIPLRGATVSGLHVPWNLQHLPAAENMRKGNKLIEV